MKKFMLIGGLAAAGLATLGYTTYQSRKASAHELPPVMPIETQAEEENLDEFIEWGTDEKEGKKENYEEKELGWDEGDG